MKRVLGMTLCGLLLAGCAGGGRYVSAGNVDYGVLLSGLLCEVEDVFDYDKERSNSAKFFHDGTEPRDRFANIVVKMNGQFDRDAGLVAGVTTYGIGGPDTFSATTGVSRQVVDSGTVVLGDTAFPNARRCNRERSGEYDLSRLDLLSWYENVSSKISNAPTKEHVNSLTFVQNGSVIFGRNGLSFSFFSPGTVAPGLGFTLAHSAEITIIFGQPSSNQMVRIDPESLALLAEIIRSDGRSTSSRGRAAATQSPTEILRERQLEKLNQNIDTFIRTPNF